MSGSLTWKTNVKQRQILPRQSFSLRSKNARKSESESESKSTVFMPDGIQINGIKPIKALPGYEARVGFTGV